MIDDVLPMPTLISAEFAADWHARTVEAARVAAEQGAEERAGACYDALLDAADIGEYITAGWFDPVLRCAPRLGTDTERRARTHRAVSLFQQSVRGWTNRLADLAAAYVRAGDLDAAADLVLTVFDDTGPRPLAALADVAVLRAHPRLAPAFAMLEPAGFDARADRLAALRLAGRPLPDDLRALVKAYWAESCELLDTAEFWVDEQRVGAHRYGHVRAHGDSDRAAVDAANREVHRYLRFVVGIGDDLDSVGYWLHPDEAEFPPVVGFYHDGGTFGVLATGCTMAEALLWYMAGGDPQTFDGLAGQFREAGIPVQRRGEFQGRPAVHPQDLWEATFRAINPPHRSNSR